jgi:hypothetical protein
MTVRDRPTRVRLKWLPTSTAPAAPAVAARLAGCLRPMAKTFLTGTIGLTRNQFGVARD